LDGHLATFLFGKVLVLITRTTTTPSWRGLHFCIQRSFGFPLARSSHYTIALSWRLERSNILFRLAHSGFEVALPNGFPAFWSGLGKAGSHGYGSRSHPWCIVWVITSISTPADGMSGRLTHILTWRGAIDIGLCMALALLHLTDSTFTDGFLCMVVSCCGYPVSLLVVCLGRGLFTLHDRRASQASWHTARHSVFTATSMWFYLAFCSTVLLACLGVR
jgi:hypothetical protein